MPDNTNDTTITRLVRNKEAARERLIAAREAKGWSQDDLATQSGVNISTIRKIEQAARDTPLEAAQEFQRVFDLPFSWFLGWGSAEALPVLCAAEGFKGDAGKIPVGRHTVSPSGGAANRKRRGGG